MNHKIVAIRDRAIDAYGQPAFVRSLGQAIRSFQDEINRKDVNNPMNQHPQDYDLYHLGEYNEDTGQFQSLPIPQQICIGNQIHIKD